jgi:magnesium transporter
MEITLLTPHQFKSVPASDLPTLLQSDTEIVWVDLVGPDEESVALMRDVFHFHPLAIEDTRNQRQRPKIEPYSDYLFVILNSISCNGDNDMVFREMDVFVGKNYVVTIHAEDEPAIQEARVRLEQRFTSLPVTSGYVLYMLVDAVVDGYFPVMDVMEERIEHLGDVILTNPRPDLLEELFDLKTALITMWRVVWPQREVLNVLMRRDLPYIDEEAIQPYLRDVSDHLMWVADMVTTFRDTLTSTIDLYLSSVSNRLNRVVNRLTVFTLIIGSMTVISGFYGMNFLHTWPPFESYLGVPFVLLLMFSIPASLLVLFRKLGWY